MPEYISGPVPGLRLIAGKPPVFVAPPDDESPVALTTPEPATARLMDNFHWQVTTAAGVDLEIYFLDPFRKELQAAHIGDYTVDLGAANPGHRRPGARTFPVGVGCHRFAGSRQECKPGPGLWKVSLAPGGSGADDFEWTYLDPSGRQHPTGITLAGRPVPPALPRPKSEWRTCYCGTPHRCPACGQPYYIEMHDAAAGWCSYCYYID